MMSMAYIEQAIKKAVEEAYCRGFCDGEAYAYACEAGSSPFPERKEIIETGIKELHATKRSFTSHLNWRIEDAERYNKDTEEAQKEIDGGIEVPELPENE